MSYSKAPCPTTEPWGEVYEFCRSQGQEITSGTRLGRAVWFERMEATCVSFPRVIKHPLQYLPSVLHLISPFIPSVRLKILLNCCFIKGERKSCGRHLLCVLQCSYFPSSSSQSLDRWAHKRIHIYAQTARMLLSPRTWLRDDEWVGLLGNSCSFITLETDREIEREAKVIERGKECSKWKKCCCWNDLWKRWKVDSLPINQNSIN